MKLARAVLILVAASVAPALASGPTWDNSGNGLLNGTYYFRQVIYSADASGNASGFYAYYGNISFTGSGSYSITSATFLSDTSQGYQANSGATASGTYSVSASGYGFLSSPLITGQNVYFMVSNHILLGSETESGYNDMFVAAPYSSTLTAGSLSGNYTVSAFFPGVAASNSLDATFQLSSNGAGSLGNVNISGFSGAGATLLQASSGVKYAFSNGAYSITFPTNNNAYFYQGGGISNTSGDNGPVFLYMSPDSNFVFGGSALGFDMFVGVKNASGGTSLSGLYYEAGLDENENNGDDSYYGSFNATGGNIVGHERFLSSAATATGFTYYSSYPTSFSSTYTDPSNTVNYTVGQEGIRIGYGTGGYLGIAVALPYTPPGPSGSVYIDPTGIVNTASSAPYTAGISPGDFLTLYNGVNLASATVVASVVPFPSTLDNVKVLIDGLPAPIYYVSSTQISVIVPYEVSTFPIATIQVSNNGVLSNTVTMYVNLTTPGVFTSNPVGGIGVAAMLDFPSSGGYYVVSQNNPANPGDTVAAYLTGLGAPFPSNPDGAAGPTAGDILVQTINVDVSGISVGTPAYAGLAPGLAGLYQINFTIPTTVTAGANSLGITGPDSYSNEAYIPIGSGSTAIDRPSPEAAPAVKKRLPQRLIRPPTR